MSCGFIPSVVLRLSSLFNSAVFRKFNPTHLNLSSHTKVHNKCNVPECCHTNWPRAAQGPYDCAVGSSGSFYCEGTYGVSRVAADEAERSAQSEAPETRCADYQQDEQTRQLVVAESAATYEIGGKAQLHDSNEATPDSMSYHPRPRMMPQSCATQTLPNLRDHFRSSAPGTPPTNQRNDAPHVRPLPIPPMSHQRPYFTHPAFRT
jgi:hypothetical protein